MSTFVLVIGTEHEAKVETADEPADGNHPGGGSVRNNIGCFALAA
jgi:hypothetical protein